jgi:hypothetical protein
MCENERSYDKQTFTPRTILKTSKAQANNRQSTKTTIEENQIKETRRQERTATRLT